MLHLASIVKWRDGIAWWYLVENIIRDIHCIDAVDDNPDNLKAPERQGKALYL
jgi:hypothetical protein